MPGKRNEYIDSVKGIAIILVVVGHCVQYGSGQDYFTGGTFFSDALFKFIYGFHMPLFMAISGYLFYFSISRKAKEIVIGKLRGVLLPLFSWHTLYQVLLIVFGVSITVPTFIYSYFHTLWFLRALFFCCMLTLIVNRIFQDKVYAHLLVCCLLYLIPNRIIPDVFVFTSTFFTLGYLFNQYHIIQRLYTDSPKILHITAIILSAIYFVLLAYYQTCYYVYLSGAYLFSKNYSLPQMLFINLYRNFTAVCGCDYLIFTLCIKKTHSGNSPVRFADKTVSCVFEYIYSQSLYE